MALFLPLLFVVAAVPPDVLAAAAIETATLIPPVAMVEFDRDAVGKQIDELLTLVASLKVRSKHSDLSDLKDESMDFVFRAQNVLDTVGVGTTYATEAARVRAEPPHLRLPVLAAGLRALLLEIGD